MQESVERITERPDYAAESALKTLYFRSIEPTQRSGITKPTMDQSGNKRHAKNKTARAARKKNRN